MKLDLHLHSTASDGQYAPAQIVRMAVDRDLEVIALTDHDTVAGIEEAEQEAGRSGIRFIPGIEISAQDVTEIHILGYGIDNENQELLDRCREFSDSRLHRAEVICSYLADKGVSVSLEEVRGYAGDTIVARPHFAAFLMDHGYVDSRKAAFEQYLDTEDFHRAVNRIKPTCEAAIRLIHAAGGRAFLAHPVQYKMSEDTLSVFVRRLKDEAGLDGIECVYSKNTAVQTAGFLRLAKKYDLLISCGSDFHGEQVKPDIQMRMETDREYLKWIDHINYENGMDE